MSMSSGEDAHVGEVHQSASAGSDAYVAGGDITVNQHFSSRGTRSQAEVDPNEPNAGDGPWTRIARGHIAWQKAEAGPGRDELLTATLATITGLHRQYTAAMATCSDDPWLDEQVPVRMAEGVGALLRGVSDELLLSPAEAALLTVIPFLHATRWMVNASRLRPGGPAGSWLADPPPPDAKFLAQFARAYPRLSRAFSAGSTDTATAIGWWLLRRWLDRERMRAPNRDELIAELVSALPTDSSWPVSGLIADVLSPGRLSGPLRDVDGELDLLTDADYRGRLATYVRTPVGRDSTAQDIRDRLVGFCLMLASAMALDPGSLGNLVVEHSGGPDKLSLADLITTVRAARWHRASSRLVLHAACRHEAVEIALRERASQVSAILDALHKAVGTGADDLRGLNTIPARASAEEVRAAADDLARPVYASPGMRFRLADDRIRELLMGESLYSDKALAIRELYQNALDACRYRQARTQRLERAQDLSDLPGPRWEGGIHLFQGTENGRAFLQCTDNGIGMGEYHLRQVFSQVGTRFVDLPEFLEEQAEWNAAGIRFAPNSRFGIGVLSYFMLADTVEINTCRLDYDGVPGERLRVTIPGPGSLFRVHPLGKGSVAGTTVRLYLNDPDKAPSCVETLRKLLLVAEFRTKATDGTKNQAWEPGALSLFAPAVAKRAAEQKRASQMHGQEAGDSENAVTASGASDVVSAPDTPVWWCAGEGGILADGLWAGEALYGAFVNLAGDSAPEELSVDRESIRRYDTQEVQRYLRKAVPAILTAPLTRHQESVGARIWLCRIAAQDPVTADALFDQLTASDDWTWRIKRTNLNPAEFGCLASDLSDGAMWTAREQFGLDLHDPPIPGRADSAGAWRGAAWLAVAAGLDRDPATGDMVTARPSDDLLLAYAADSLIETSQVSRATVLRGTVRLGYSVPEVRDRLSVLGYGVPAFPDPPVVTADDMRLVSVGANAKSPWLTDHDPVSKLRVLLTAARLRLAPRDVAARLLALGYDVPVAGELPVTVPPELTRLIEALPDLYLTDDEPLRKAQLIATAAAAGLTIAKGAEYLTSVGFVVPDVSGLPSQVTEQHVRLVSQDLNGKSPWLDDGKPISRAHLVHAARALSWDLSTVASTLRGLGYQVPPVWGPSVTVEDLDQWIVEGSRLGVLVDERISTGCAIAIARQWGCDLTTVAERLGKLGYNLPSIPASPNEVTERDVLLVSRHLTGASPWLPDDGAVPKAFVAKASAGLGWTVPEVVSRLTGLGYQVPDIDGLPNELDDQDAALLFAEFDDGATYSGHGTEDDPWPSDVDTVSRARLIVGAARSGRAVADVAARFSRLGFSLPLARVEDLPKRVTTTDLRLISLDLDAVPPWLRDEEVSPDFLLRAAITLDMTIEEVAGRLGLLGFRVHPAREFSSPGAYVRAMEDHAARAAGQGPLNALLRAPGQIPAKRPELP
jgi:hypothetical protein